MAERDSHAAWQNRYEVHEGFGSEPSLDAGLRFESSDFGAAVDFVFSYLERRDPRREGVVLSLEIVRVAGAERETVWNYSYGEAATSPKNSVGVWGFDVTRPWAGGARAWPRAGAGR